VTAPKLKIKKRQTLADQLRAVLSRLCRKQTRTRREDYLRKNQIALAFGVSRPVVREALRKLQEAAGRGTRGVGSFAAAGGPSEKLN